MDNVLHALNGLAIAKAYGEFSSSMHDQNYGKGYKLFLRQPAIVQLMSLAEIPAHLSDIRQYVGKREAEHFYETVTEQIKELELILQQVNASPWKPLQSDDLIALQAVSAVTSN